MKIILSKIGHWLYANFDDLTEIRHFISIIAFSIIGWIPTANLLNNYGIIADYGFFSIFGQCLSYVARYLNPKLFPKQEEYSSSAKWLRFGSNLLMAWTFGVFMTPIAFKYFEANTVSIVAVAILVGAFYDLILRPLIRAAYEASNWLNKKWKKVFSDDNDNDEIK